MELFSFSVLRLLQKVHIKNLELYYETSYLPRLIPDEYLSDGRLCGMLREERLHRSRMTKFIWDLVSGSAMLVGDFDSTLAATDSVLSQHTCCR